MLSDDGRRDYLLRVVVADVRQLELFIVHKLSRIPGVANIRSSFALKQVKYKTELPLDASRVGEARGGLRAGAPDSRADLTSRRRSQTQSMICASAGDLQNIMLHYCLFVNRYDTRRRANGLSSTMLRRRKNGLRDIPFQRKRRSTTMRLETREGWMRSTPSSAKGPTRADFCSRGLRSKSMAGVDAPDLHYSAYRNSIPLDRQGDYPGDRCARGAHHLDRSLERSGNGHQRQQGAWRSWRPHRELRFGAEIFEVGFNHFFRGNDDGDGDLVFSSRTLRLASMPVRSSKDG